ncbi:hypothetical protein M758_5G164800 [Ceratodon purpureus]|nr:hypothetical protein M758_5G164800 [Ceratodon purpureus]
MCSYSPLSSSMMRMSECRVSFRVFEAGHGRRCLIFGVINCGCEREDGRALHGFRRKSCSHPWRCFCWLGLDPAYSPITE